MDRAWIPEGVQRCSAGAFYSWMALWLFVLGAAVTTALLILWKGLNQTNMNDYFGFGAWITADLGVIALGAGAFFSGFLTYVVRIKELKALINFAVIIGFICYSSALLILILDIGQPLRCWFGYWFPNIHSMLTEVIFCITLYFTVLTIEYVPLILENRKIYANPVAHTLSHNFHEAMAIFAAIGTFLSFFHQGSLGGMYGVMYARPFAFREGFFVWPWTFFLFIFSAISTGPTFTILITMILQKVTKKRLVPRESLSVLAKIAGCLLCGYVIVKIADTYYWATHILPARGLTFAQQYHGYQYGMWLPYVEIGLCGVIPAIILITRRLRENDKWLVLACALASFGVVLNRFIFTVQTLAMPVLPFDKWYIYFPSWQEWVTSMAVIAYGAVIISLSYRYLPVFPYERDLNPPAR
ncbi:MAG TPA: molybdopterin oxidoreductase [Proteobacteria bacterium]|nr:molybdopterin oxidoreductase [Pseudomonadota bacterium]